jgi:hypothetical protein
LSFVLQGLLLEGEDIVTGESYSLATEDAVNLLRDAFVTASSVVRRHGIRGSSGEYSGGEGGGGSNAGGSLVTIPGGEILRCFEEATTATDSTGTAAIAGFAVGSFAQVQYTARACLDVLRPHEVPGGRCGTYDHQGCVFREPPLLGCV